jgi:hypothetical protein
MLNMVIVGFIIMVNKYLTEQLKRRKGLFWHTVPKGSIYHGEKGMVVQRTLHYAVRKANKEYRKRPKQDTALRKHFQ